MMKFGRFFQIALLITLAAGASPAMSAFWEWSKTASSNATADPSINWSEGMSPSSANDSARAMMARAAEYRDDISGALATAGTATAYTLTTNQGLDAVPTNGQMIAFTPNATNGVGVTLTVDGGTTYAIQTSPGVAVGAGTLVAGTPYSAKFSLSDSAWVLRDFYGNAYQIPLGGLLHSTVDTAPNSNFVLGAGQCISRTTYAAYFAAVGTRFSSCDGVSTFGVIDLRGRNAAGLDNMGGTSANRMTNSGVGCGVNFTAVGAACGFEYHTLLTTEIPSHTHANAINDPGHTHPYGSGQPRSYASPGFSDGLVTGAASAFATTNANTSGVTISNAAAGGGGAHSIVNPVIGVNIFVRIF